jgi:hypothetical protein
MKTATHKSKKRSSNFKPDDAYRDSHAFKKGEKAVDSTPLSQDVSQEFREPTLDEMNDSQKDTSNNWSQAEDRGEDLVEGRDPFIQPEERDMQIPPELIQERAYYLYEQRGQAPGSDLADWFEAERQLRQEKAENL